MNKHPHFVLVIGAVNIDICGRPFSEPLMHDSNPGTISYSLGGVGRNISHNLRLLSVPVKFLTALGGDRYAKDIEQSCNELSIDLSHAATFADKLTSSYLYITDSSGDMILAVCDTDVSNCITPEYLQRQIDIINTAAIVVFDANLAPETIEWLCANCKAPLFADPVSVAKAPRLISSLGKIHTIKPNKIEAEVLSGINITDAKSMELAVSALLQTGLRRVFLSLGAGGVYCAEGEHRWHMPALNYSLVNTTGCGDAFMAALAWSHFEGLNTPESAKAGLAAASAALENDGAINPNLSAGLIKVRM